MSTSAVLIAACAAIAAPAAPLAPAPPRAPTSAVAPTSAQHPERSRVDARMERLDESLARLDERLKREQALGDARLSILVARAREHARLAAEAAAGTALNADALKEITERAMARARSGELAAATRAMRRLEPRLRALSERLEALETEEAAPPT